MEDQAIRKELSQIALRLANMEILVNELLDRRRANVRTKMRRQASLRARLRAESLADPVQPSARHHEMAQQILARLRR